MWLLPKHHKQPRVTHSGVAGRRPGEGIRVLAVACDASLARLLDRAGRFVQCERVTDYDAALDLAWSNGYDVAVLAGQPGGDLAGFCRRLRDAGVLCPILVVAEAARVSDVVEALQSGADGFLIGPISDIEFMARLEAAQRRHNYDRQGGRRFGSGDQELAQTGPAQAPPQDRWPG